MRVPSELYDVQVTFRVCCLNRCTSLPVFRSQILTVLSPVGRWGRKAGRTPRPRKPNPASLAFGFALSCSYFRSASANSSRLIWSPAVVTNCVPSGLNATLVTAARWETEPITSRPSATFQILTISFMRAATKSPWGLSTMRSTESSSSPCSFRTRGPLCARQRRYRHSQLRRESGQRSKYSSVWSDLPSSHAACALQYCLTVQAVLWPFLGPDGFFGGNVRRGETVGLVDCAVLASRLAVGRKT